MKKAVLVFLSIFLLACAASCLAEQPQEITFRNLPWRISPDEALELLKQDFGLDELDTHCFVGPQVFCGTGDFEGPSVPMILYNITLPNLTVAGYEGNSILLFFLLTPTEDGTDISYSHDTALLWKAEYGGLTRSKKGSDNVSLSDKLTKLYGERKEHWWDDFHRGKHSNYLEYYWTGLNSSVVLTKTSPYKLTYYCSGDDLNSIVKTTEAIVANSLLLRQQKEELKRQQELENANTDGL
ncbi:MAG: hypothetical protein IKB78_04260 [Clostridia bacterium]|nr:hypothetical protein [Clostridia bacterium]